MEMANSLGGCCAICVARGSPKLPQAGLEILNNLGHLCAVCMTIHNLDHR